MARENDVVFLVIGETEGGKAVLLEPHGQPADQLPFLLIQEYSLARSNPMPLTTPWSNQLQDFIQVEGMHGLADFAKGGKLAHPLQLFQNLLLSLLEIRKHRIGREEYSPDPGRVPPVRGHAEAKKNLNDSEEPIGQGKTHRKTAPAISACAAKSSRPPPRKRPLTA